MGAAALVELGDTFFGRADNSVIFIRVFKKIRDIEEGISFQTDIDKGRLHPRKHLGHSTLADASDNPLVPFALDVDFNDFAALQDGGFGFL